MENISYDSLPRAISEILNKVEGIEKALFEARNLPNQNDTDRWFNLDELCDYLPDKPKKAGVYALVRNRIIPHYKREKVLYFLKSEIDSWLKTSRRKTISEIDAERDAFLSKKSLRKTSSKII